MGQLDLGVVTDANKAAKSDLTSINATGTTNTTGAAISSGTFFYLDGTLVRAKANIAIDATFTENTNYKVVTAGGLNDLKSASSAFIPGTKVYKRETFTTETDGYLFVGQSYAGAGYIYAYFSKDSVEFGKVYLPQKTANTAANGTTVYLPKGVSVNMDTNNSSWTLEWTPNIAV